MLSGSKMLAEDPLRPASSVLESLWIGIDCPSLSTDTGSDFGGQVNTSAILLKIFLNNALKFVRAHYPSESWTLALEKHH